MSITPTADFALDKSGSGTIGTQIAEPLYYDSSSNLNIRSASNSKSGVVNTTTQIFNGIKSIIVPDTPITNAHAINKNYAMQNFALSLNWIKGVLDIVNVSTISSPINGARYIQSIDASPYVQNYIYEFDSDASAYVEYEPIRLDAVVNFDINGNPVSPKNLVFRNDQWNEFDLSYGGRIDAQNLAISSTTSPQIKLRNTDNQYKISLDAVNTTTIDAPIIEYLHDVNHNKTQVNTINFNENNWTQHTKRTVITDLDGFQPQGITWVEKYQDLYILTNTSEAGIIDSSIAISKNGYNWQKVQVIPDGETQNRASCVCHDGTKFIIVAQDRIFTTTDGQTFTEIIGHNLSSAVWVRMIFTNIGGINRYIICNKSEVTERLMQSTDLVTWTEAIDSGGNPVGRNVKFDDLKAWPAKNLIVACGTCESGTEKLRWSEDGITWGSSTGTSTYSQLANFRKMAFNDECILVFDNNAGVNLRSYDGKAYSRLSTNAKLWGCEYVIDRFIVFSLTSQTLVQSLDNGDSWAIYFNPNNPNSISTIQYFDNHIFYSYRIIERIIIEEVNFISTDVLIDSAIVPRKDSHLTNKKYVDDLHIETQQYTDDSQNLQGQLLKNPTGFANRDDSKLSISGTTFTIEPDVLNFKYYIWNNEFVKESATTIALNAGENHLYFDNTGTLNNVASFSDSIITANAYITFIYLDGSNNVVLFCDERHGTSMSPQTHLNLHYNTGAVYLNGMTPADFTIGDGSIDNHASFSISAGYFFDEDLKNTLGQKNIDNNMGILYRSAASSIWKIDKANSVGPYLTNTGTNLLYRQDGVNLVDVANNKYVCGHIIATNSTTELTMGINKKYYGLLGNIEYGNIIAARDGAQNEINTIILTGLPLPEFIFVATVIYQTSSSYANSAKARIVEVATGVNFVDWRTARLNSVVQSVNEHANLGGLLADDHPQYALRGENVEFNSVQITTMGATDGDVATKKYVDDLQPNQSLDTTDNVEFNSVLTKKIDIKDSNPVELLLTNTVGAPDDTITIKFNYLSTNQQGYIKTILNSGWPTDMAFGVASGEDTGLEERMRITSTGRVGIGTTTPDSKLHVNGEVQATSMQITTMGATDGDVATKKYVDDSVNDVDTFNQALNTTDTPTFSAINISTGVLKLQATTSKIIYNENVGIKFSHTADGTGEESIIGYNGRVGIGTITPNTLLDVAGVITANSISANLDMGDASAGTLSVNRGGTGATAFTANQLLFGNGTSAISSSSNLIWDGTSLKTGTPSSDLPSIMVGRKLGNPSITANGSDWLILDSGGTSNAGINYYATGDIILANGGGNVGIGNTAPDTKLHVSGNIKAQNVQVTAMGSNNNDLATKAYVDGNTYVAPTEDNVMLKTRSITGGIVFDVLITGATSGATCMLRSSFQNNTITYFFGDTLTGTFVNGESVGNDVEAFGFTLFSTPFAYSEFDTNVLFNKKIIAQDSIQSLNGDIIIPDNKSIYIGDPEIAGSWRINRYDANNGLQFERLHTQGGAYNWVYRFSYPPNQGGIENPPE